MTKFVELREVCDWKTKYGFFIITTEKSVSNKRIEDAILNAKYKAEKECEDWQVQDLIDFMPKTWKVEYNDFDCEVGV